MCNKKGFTLLEVLLAVVLMVMGSVTLLQAIGTGLFTGGVNESELIAFNLAAEKAELIENTAYASIIAEVRGDIDPAHPELFPAFHRKVDIDDNTPTVGMKRVVVTTFWTAKGPETSTVLTTYVSNA